MHSPDPFHLTSCLHHSKRLPSTPIPEVDLIGSGNQQELSRRVESQRGNGIVAICKPAFTATLWMNKSQTFLGYKLPADWDVNFKKKKKGPFNIKRLLVGPTLSMSSENDVQNQWSGSVTNFIRKTLLSAQFCHLQSISNEHPHSSCFCSLWKLKLGAWHGAQQPTSQSPGQGAHCFDDHDQNTVQSLI